MKKHLSLFVLLFRGVAHPVQHLVTGCLALALIVLPLAVHRAAADPANIAVNEWAFFQTFNVQPGQPFHSTTLQENSPVQTTGSTLPAGVVTPKLIVPAACTRWVPFAGKPGQPASHEGLDLVHHDPAKPHVMVMAAADGVVAYVRTGCPQSSMFSRNTSLREAGAGWGNHVVIYHGPTGFDARGNEQYALFTRYAHLAPGSITLKPGDRVGRGTVVGEMGNTGRSELRHLHFEFGIKKSRFVTTQPAQSLDAVYDPRKFMPDPMGPN